MTLCVLGISDVRTAREYGKDYIGVEAEAKAAKRGIWAGSFQYPAQVRCAVWVLPMCLPVGPCLSQHSLSQPCRQMHCLPGLECF
jgi:hypothetical protein